MGTIPTRDSSYDWRSFGEHIRFSKIATGYPYNDFTVTNEPVTGDINLSVPEGFAPGRLSFFATTRKGFVYKFACTVEGSEAEQVFITNPALAQSPEPSIATATPQDAAVALIQAMATGGVPNGYQVRQTATAPLRVGDLSIRMMSQYRGGGLLGKVLRVENRGDNKTTLDPKLIAPSDALAISLGAVELMPRAATTLYVVQTDGSRRMTAPAAPRNARPADSPERAIGARDAKTRQRQRNPDGRALVRARRLAAPRQMRHSASKPMASSIATSARRSS